MGGFDDGETGIPGDPGAPRVVVTGFAFWGGVGVERKLTREERRQAKLERRQAREEERLERRQAREVERRTRRELHGDFRHDRRRHEE
jgi:hypothetical protein